MKENIENEVNLTEMSILSVSNVEQGSEEWHALRCGVMTASEIKLIMTPTGKAANNDKSRAHLYELAAQRITGYVEPHYISEDMMRGHIDEVRAKSLYSEKYAPIHDAGFMTRIWPNGFTLGFSPDGLVGEDGLVESKSRRQKYQVQTALDIAAGGSAPDEYMLQIQTGLLVSGRQWCDFLSYSGGLPMIVKRVERDEELCERILDCARFADAKIVSMMSLFSDTVSEHGWFATERVEEQEMVVDDE